MPGNNSATLPKGWPIDPSLKYISKSGYAASLSLSTLRSLHALPPKSEVISQPLQSPCPLVRITSITSPTHPAHNQHGLFATRSLPPESLIIIYLGLVHSSEDTDPDSDYDLSMDRELGIGVDARYQGNEARFINDYRGVSDKANAEFRDCWIRIGDKVERRIGVFVKKDVKKGIGKGQEILVSYGKGFWNERLSATTDHDAKESIL
jgi:SET domain-containing protein